MINKKIITLTTSFNRYQTTALAYESLSLQNLPCKYSIIHFLVDNNSNDGTPEFIKKIVPDINVIKTPRNMYWAQSLFYGYSKIKNLDYDYLFIFNDDVILNRSTLFECISKIDDNSVVVVPFSDSKNNFSYGMLFSKFNIPIVLCKNRPSRNFYPVTFNMNGVLIPKIILDNYGFISHEFTHAFADLDYGLYLNRLGVKILTLDFFGGICEQNSDDDTSRDSSLPFLTRLQKLFSPKEQLFIDRYIYSKRNIPLIWPFFLIWPYIRFFLGIR